ncbi:ARM repeat superfamily protein [Euphorbia peplus]|nr:ARM repeat superfamily protein [Euphorbia peplus]
MEKRLRSSVQSSAEEFLSSAVKLNPKSSKSTLKTLIHAISSSSPLFSDFPSSLHRSISDSITAFRDFLHNPHPSSPDPPNSPPSKRFRRSSRKANPNSQKEEPFLFGEKQDIVDQLQILIQVSVLCLSHPKNVFSPSDLLPAVRMVHDNLVLFESDTSLLLEIASLCELYWKEDYPGREMLVSQSLPFLVSRSLTSKKKVDVHRVYAMREALTLFDFEDESIEDLKSLLIRCVIAPLFLKTEDGRRFIAFLFGLSSQLLKEALAMIRSQIPFGRKSILEAYGEILFRAWKGFEGDFKDEIENGFLQGLIDSAIHANSSVFAASIRRVLGGFITQRVTDGVEKFLFRLAEPVIFRSLQVANSSVRLNALHLLLDLFPLEDPDATKEVKDTLLEKQFFLLEKLLMDECPDVRVVAVEGCCRVLYLFWEIIPPATITKLLTKIFDDMSLDICHEVRLSTLNGIAYLLGNPQSHEILKVLLPRLGHLMLDSVISIRVAVLDLLLLIRDIRAFQFNKVVGLDVLLSSLLNDQSQVAKKITKLLMPSYFPSKVSTEEACNRCITLIKRSPMAGARFCEYAALEGASLKSLLELVRTLMNLVLSQDKLDTNQLEGLLACLNHLCKSLVHDPSYKNALKELFSGGKAKRIFAAASTGCAQSSVLNIFSLISPEDASEVVEECMHLITDCGVISSNVKLQDEVRSAQKFLLSLDGFDDMFETLTQLLQKIAYRCHIKFGIEIPKKIISPRKRKKCKSSVKISAKWKHNRGKATPNFENDYSTALGIAWQIKDMLLSEEFRKVILQSQALEIPFLALKVISEASILHGVSRENVDTTPVIAYAALALHMTLQKINLNTNDQCHTENDRTESSSTLETLLDKTADHLLSCSEKMIAAGGIGESGNLTADTPGGDKAPHHNTKKRKEPRSSSSNNNGFHHDKEKTMSNTVKIPTAILKFIVDSVAMGFLNHIQTRCLSFASLYVKHVISILAEQSSRRMQFKEDDLKESILCMKSSFSYAAKLLNLVLVDTNEASPPRQEAFDLANDMLDLIVSVELYLGSSYAGRLAAAAKPWLPDLILSLTSGCILKHASVENTYLTTLSNVKRHFPSWPLILAKLELSEVSKVSSDEEDDNVLEAEEFLVLKGFMESILSLLKGSQNVLDAVGVMFLTHSVVGLERKDFGLVLGILHFVCVKLVGADDKEWNELDLMLSCLPDIYPMIEREIDEENDEVEKQKLHSARTLLEPVWLYHVYETGRFTEMEE